MERRIALVLAAALAACVCAYAQAGVLPQYAIATSLGGDGTSGLYMFAMGGPWSSSVVYSSSQMMLGDVKVYGDYVFVLDDAAKALRIFRIRNAATSPTADLVKTVTLSGHGASVGQLKSLDVTPNGQAVYLTWDSSAEPDQAHYAYVTPGPGGWGDANVSLGSIPAAFLGSPDVAAFQDGGMMKGITSHTMAYVSPTNQTQVTTVYQTNSSGPTGVGNTTDKLSTNPRAIAMSGLGYAYVVTSNNAEFGGEGGLAVVNPSTRTLVGTGVYALPGFDPQDVVAFTLSGAHYLGIVGKVVGTETYQVWKVPLAESGEPTLGSPAAFIVASGPNHYLGASKDGTIVWVSNYAGGSVVALDAATWTPAVGGQFDGLNTVLQIDGYVVPEPSWLASLPVFALGVGALIRRRKP